MRPRSGLGSRLTAGLEPAEVLFQLWPPLEQLWGRERRVVRPRKESELAHAQELPERPEGRPIRNVGAGVVDLVEQRGEILFAEHQDRLPHEGDLVWVATPRGAPAFATLFVRGNDDGAGVAAVDRQPIRGRSSGRLVATRLFEQCGPVLGEARPRPLAKEAPFEDGNDLRARKAGRRVGHPRGVCGSAPFPRSFWQPGLFFIN